jgi:hypothetical protein
MSAPASPYVVSALIGAIPATLSATAAWRSSHKGRNEEKADHTEVEASLHTVNQNLIGLGNEILEVKARVAQVDLRLDTLKTGMDVRFDAIEDKVERHLGWHRSQAEDQLPTALMKESTGDNDTNQHPRVRPDSL